MLIRKVNLSSVTKVGDRFLCFNKGLKEIDLPDVTSVGSHSFSLGH